MITTREAADVLGVDPSHVRRLLIDGKLRGERRGSRHRGEWLVDPASVEAYLMPSREGRPRRRAGMYTFRLEGIFAEDLAATDLRQEAVSLAEGGHTLLTYAINIYRDGEQMPEAANLLHVDGVRFGVAWGADADWYDSTGDIERDVDLWLNDPEALAT